MASVMGGTIFSRTCGCVTVFVNCICIVCSRGVGSSAATTSVPGAVRVGGVVRRERQGGDLGITACLGVARAPRSAIVAPVGLCPSAAASAMSTSTRIDHAVTVTFVGKVE